jgi:hypothetical protein
MQARYYISTIVLILQEEPTIFRLDFQDGGLRGEGL